MVQSGYNSGTEHNVTVSITNCVNVGNISISNVQARRGGGGFVGWQNGVNASSPDQSKSVLSIENCLNTGYIEGKGEDKDAWAAGLVGFVAQQNISTSLKNSVNVGEIHAEGNAYAGGLSGRVTAMILENCGSFGTVTATQSGRHGIAFGNTGWWPKSATGLHYIEIDGAGDVSSSRPITDTSHFANTVKVNTLAEGIAWTNALLGDKVGKVIMNNDATGAVLASPTFAGVQEATKTAGKIRLVATLNDSLNYSEVGFKVTLVGGETVVKSCNEVYRKLLTTTGDGFQAEVTANELYGAYVFALSIENIPVSDTPVTLIVTPYGKDANDSTVEYAGASYEVVYTGGKVVSINACA